MFQLRREGTYSCGAHGKIAVGEKWGQFRNRQEVSLWEALENEFAICTAAVFILAVL